MDVSDKNEIIGGGSSAFAAGGFGIGLFLMAIFLVVLFSLFRNGCGNGWGSGCQRDDSCADKLTWSRYANFVDPEIMRNHIEQTRDTGDIRKDIATENGEIKCSIDRQTRDIQIEVERTTGAIIANQNANARAAEQMFWNAELNRKAEALAEQRERINTLQAELMASNAAREADRRQMETMAAMNGQFFSLTTRLNGIENSMVKAPTFYPYGGINSVNLCGYNPCNSGCGCNGNA